MSGFHGQLELVATCTTVSGLGALKFATLVQASRDIFPNHAFVEPTRC